MLFKEGGKCGVTHLKLFFALAFVMGGSEGPRLQNDPFDSCRSPCSELSGITGVRSTPCKYVWLLVGQLIFVFRVHRHHHCYHPRLCHYYLSFQTS